MQDQPHVEMTPELPTEQAADLAELENLAGEVVEPGITPEPEPEPPPPEIPTADLLLPLVSMLCASVAPAWAIGEAEREQLAGAYAAVIDKYYPDGLPMGPEVGALMITAAVVMPHLGQPLKIKPKEKKQESSSNENE